ncbi:MAG TPA: hypothetical protein VMZ28_16970, partial [Kofleriaceae bacterium]|nr:hypothetical protein [Kofleriaceae bacterium]
TTLSADPSARRDYKVAELKAGYASQLVAMREAELDVRLAELEAARSGRTPTVGARDFLRDRDDSQRSLARAREQLARQQGEVERQRVAWDEQRRAADVAGLDRSRRQNPPIPASGANEGPAQPSSTQDDNFAR